ncbi:MAG: RluA family pseudouridine synthase [Thermodesulfovibrionales bacterium]|nr:RluA family pseudouridine synthase [Thermodesulfovibrionales bacterium]
MSHDTEIQHIFVSLEDRPKRLDVFLAEKTGKTRSSIQRLIETQKITVNNKAVYCSYKPKTGDKISIITEIQQETTLLPEPLDIKIHYQDDYIVVVDKPAGMVVYPCIGHKSGTLLNAVYYHCRKLANAGLPLRPGVVHRLDMDTSGVMVVAIDDSAYYKLVEYFKKRQIERLYKCIVYGRIKADTGEICYHIGRSEHDRKRMSIKTKRGKEAITTWRVIEGFENATFLGIKLGTGRTHQIRVHMASIGHPVLGDKVYGKKMQIMKGKKTYTLQRQMLHAEYLAFTHPITGQGLGFQSQLPKDMQDCLDFLRDK